jgi:cell division protein FtsW (lipid II flippase)
VIDRLQTPRNRELVNLLVVALLVVTGFGAVFIARENAVSTRSLSYAAFFIGLYCIAHVVLRIALPRADPYLLPLVRPAGRHRRGRDLPHQPYARARPGLWIVVGLIVFSIVVFDVPRHPQAGGLTYTCGAAGGLLLMATWSLGTEVNGAPSCGSGFAGYQIQPGEFAKVLLVVSSPATCAENREVLERPVPPRDGRAASRAAAPDAAARDVGLRARAAGRRERLRSSLCYYSILLAMLYIATGRCCTSAAASRRSSLGALGRRAGGAARAGPHRHVVEPVGHPADERLPDRAVAVLDRRRRHLRHRLRPGLRAGRRATGDPRRADRLHLLGDRLRDRARRRRGPCCVYLAFVYRGMKIASMADDGFTKLLARGPVVRDRLPGVRASSAASRKLLPLTGITLPFVSYGGSRSWRTSGCSRCFLCVSERVNREGAGGVNGRISRLYRASRSGSWH